MCKFLRHKCMIFFILYAKLAFLLLLLPITVFDSNLLSPPQTFAFFSSLHPSHQLGWSLLTSASSCIIHLSLLSLVPFGLHRKGLLSNFILATFPPLSLVPFEFFQMCKTFFGYEICLFRFVGRFHVQHSHISFLHRWIQIVYPEMSPSIKLHLRHNLPEWLCPIANRQQQCFYLIISCIHSLYASLVPFADSPHFSSPLMSFFIIGLNV